MVKQFLLVALGGAIGTGFRFAANLALPNKNFPLTTLLINIIGSFVIGMVIGYSLKNDAFSNWKLFLATGVCGGFTTFSAFSVENLLLLQNDRWLLSIAYILASVLLGIIAAWLGYKIIHA